MTDRTVTVRLRLDSTQWAAGQRSATAANDRLSASARAAATAAERDAQRTAAAVQGTFRGMAAAGQTALSGLDAAATRSSQALARNTAAMTRQTAAAAAAAARATTQAAAAATRQVAAAAGEIPPAFRAAATAGTSALAGLDAASATSRAQVARTLLAQRQAMTSAAASVAQASVGMSAATAAAAAGTSRLSLATRLALGEAATASAAAVAATVASTARISTSAHLAASGASSAAAAAAAATVRADATARALSSTFGAAAARARLMSSAVVAASERSQRSLRAVRTASLGLVAAFGFAVYASSKFESAMSRVKASTQAPAAELVKLRDAAIKAGSSTQYSATQSADAITELAKAGVSISDILGGALKGTLALAAAGDMDVADSAIVAAKAMNSFALKGSDMAHIADVIAAAAGKSATDVHQMSLAFAQSSLLAHQTGLSLEQAAGALALFAQNGLVGSDAGTSLKTMLMRLTPQSAEAEGMMQKLGFSAYDSAGRFVGLSETADRMRLAFGKLTPEARNSAMGVIFGSDAIRAATIVTQAGAAGIDTWTRAANDQGYATRYAATQTDNLEGDVRRLASSLETALISSGTAANGVLRDMAQALTTVVRWYTSLPPAVQQSMTMLGGMAGVIGLIASGLLILLPRIMTTRRELVALGLTAQRTRGMMAGLGRLGLVIGALTALTYATDKITEAMKKPGPNVATLTNSLVDLAGSSKATGDSVKELDDFGDAVARIAHPSNLNRMTDVASSIGHFGGHSNVASLTEAHDKVDSLDEALAGLVQSGSADVAAKAFAKMGTEAEKSGTSTEKLKGMLPKYRDALAEADTQQKLAASSQKKLGEAAETTAGELKDARTAAEKLTDALDSLNGANIDVAESNINFRQSLADLRQGIKDNGTSLDVTTTKGRQNASMFLDAAKAAAAHAEAVSKQTNSIAAGGRTYAQDIALLKQQMVQQGFSTDQVNKLTAAYLRVPPKVLTKVQLQDAATKELRGIQRQLRDTKDKNVTVTALTKTAEKELKDLGFKVTHLKGGQVRVTVPTAGPRAAVATIQRYLDSLRVRPIVVTTTTSGNVAHESGKYADGGIVHRAADGLFVPGYAPRQDTVRAWLSPGEGVLVPETVRALGGAKAIAALNRWGRYGSAAHFASGGVAGGVSYTPTAAPVLGGPGDAMDRYNAAVERLKDAFTALGRALADQAAQARQLAAAEARQRQVRADGARRVGQAEANLERVRGGHHSAAQLAAAEDRLSNARAAAAKANAAAAKSVAKEQADAKAAAAAVGKAKGAVGAADAALGLAPGAKPPAAFDLAAYQKQLGKSAAQTEAWRKSLATIGSRGGAEIRSILEGMGEDGYALVQALAKAGDRQFADIVSKLKATAGVASATLADFQHQVDAASKTNAQFAADLQKLAAAGYGDLAQALAAQGDAAAQDLAHQAAGNSKAAGAANAAVKASGQALTGDDLANSLTLLATLRGGPGRGFAELIGAGLDTATIRALVPKIMKQLTGLPAQYRTAFLQQWAGQSGAVAMARGGVLTRPTAVVAAEAGVPEAYIPWNGSARSAALLARTATAMGYQLVPAGRYAGAGGSGGGMVQSVTNNRNVTLNGARQTTAEQLHDIVRTMQFIG